MTRRHRYHLRSFVAARPPRGRAAASSAVLALLLAACADAPAEPSAARGERVAVCHGIGTAASVTSVLRSELAGRLARGDYVVRLTVDPASPAIGDSTHFARIGDAIAAARAVRLARGDTVVAGCRITITVAHGLFVGSTSASPDPRVERFPLVIDVPDIALQGSFQMTLDEQGRATGLGQTAEVTTLAASPGLLTENLGGAQNNVRAEPIVVVNAHPNGPRGDGAMVLGFVFRSGNEAAEATPGGNAVFAMRVRGLAVSGNRIDGGFSEPIDLRASSARVERNYLSGRGGSCGICLAGPGEYHVGANRQMGPGGIPGILILPTTLLPVPPVVEQYVLPPAAAVMASVVNNEVRNHQAVPVGVGIRVGALGPGSSNVVGTSRVSASDNTLADNRFGIIVEASFPVANTALRGDIDVTLHGNTMTRSCQTDLLVSLSRHTTGLGLQSAPYLRNSTFTLQLGGDVAWANAWFANPDGFNNSLVVDGERIPNGARVAYDAARVCPQP